MKRRQFMKATALVGIATMTSPSRILGANDRLKIGVIGTGVRGQWNTKLLLDRPDVDVTAIWDIDD